ncbi:MAG: PIN domain-containing protein [Cyclobacteriaceae bacterium]|nr:PIN domain-containing protein [Cyclobacteriaceae bacterium]
MPRVLFDTTLIVHLYRKKKEAFHILNKYKNQEMCISIVTYVEFVANANRKKEARKTLRSYTILPIDDRVSETVKKQSFLYEVPKTQNCDFLIACTAMSHGITLVTNNEKHFNKYRGLKTDFYSTS